MMEILRCLSRLIALLLLAIPRGIHSYHVFRPSNVGWRCSRLDSGLSRNWCPTPRERTSTNHFMSLDGEAMFSVSYDPLEPPNQMTLERDLEDFLMERALRFYDEKVVRQKEKCYLVGLEDRSLNEREDGSRFTMEESMTELSELAGAAGLTVVGSTYQRVQRPNLEYYVGPGKLKDIVRSMAKHKCSCVIFDVELSPSQQKNLEISLNQEIAGKRGSKDKNERVKVLDRTALILDIFAQHARTREGQLQVQLALLTYRLPRLTNMWSHLERQSAGARGRSNGGVGLRGPGEKQLESDRRQMKSKISILKRAIDAIRRHRSSHRRRRRRLGVPVVAMVGYTNAGKSTLLNAFTSAGVFAADMLFATLDPTTRLVRVSGLKNPDILLTDTVGFIQKLPTNLVAAFRATLEEIAEADVLLHVTDVSNDAWRKQEAAVLRELSSMGLAGKPIVTVWNKVDLVPERKEFLKLEASKRPQTVAVSAKSGEGFPKLMSALEEALSSQMELVTCIIPYNQVTLVDSVYNMGILDEVQYLDEGIYVRGKVPLFLKEQIESRLSSPSMSLNEEYEDGEFNFDVDDPSLISSIDDILAMGVDLDDDDVDSPDGIYKYDDDEDYGEDTAAHPDAVLGSFGSDKALDSDLPLPLGVSPRVSLKASSYRSSVSVSVEGDAAGFDWRGLAKGRHSAMRALEDREGGFATSLGSKRSPQRNGTRRQTWGNQIRDEGSSRSYGHLENSDRRLNEDGGGAYDDGNFDEFDDSKLLDFDSGDFYGTGVSRS